MFTHVLFGSNDIARSKAFYDAALGALGLEPGTDMNGRVFYRSPAGVSFGLCTPADGQPATHANGGTLGFAAKDAASIDAFHAAGVANGGTDEGAPGPRTYMPGAYAAYMRDPDGNKICSFCILPE